MTDLDNDARSRWATLMDSPAAARVLGSRQVLGALARWRWTHGEPASGAWRDTRRPSQRQPDCCLLVLVAVDVELDGHRRGPAAG